VWKKVTLRVILDANFFFIPSQFKIDIFEGLMKLLNQRFEAILLSSTRQELIRMTGKGSSAKRKQAALALELAKKCRLINVEKAKAEMNDDVILRIAADWKSPVATNDRELRKKLRAKNLPAIFLRGKSRLELEGAL
jgi:rRNA-processing protein FCF1